MIRHSVHASTRGAILVANVWRKLYRTKSSPDVLSALRCCLFRVARPGRACLPSRTGHSGRQGVVRRSTIAKSACSSRWGGRASETHHLFPKAWLHDRGITERRKVNQVANLADVGWHDNSLMGSQSPAKYVPHLRAKFDNDQWGRMCVELKLRNIVREVYQQRFGDKAAAIEGALDAREREVLARAVRNRC